jgi:hypothetical protein
MRVLPFSVEQLKPRLGRSNDSSKNQWFYAMVINTMHGTRRGDNNIASLDNLSVAFFI